MAITVQEAQVVFSADGMQKVQTAAGQAAQAMTRMTTSASQAGSALRSITSLGGPLGQLFATIGVAKIATEIVKLAAGAEQTAMEFEVLTGSASNATAMIEQLREIDLKTVFGTQDLAKSASMMMRMGMSSEQVVPILGMMTEVAGSSTDKLHDLAYAMSQVQMAGRLTGQENLQLINAGFSPLAIIAEQTGRSMADLKKDMENGAISANMVKQALSDLTTGTGRLAGFQDKVAQSTSGMFAKAQTNLELLAIEIGSQVLPYANQFLQWSVNAMQSMDGLGGAFGSVLAKTAEWFTETGDYFADIGVVVGSLVGDMSTLWAGLFEDIPNYAKAAFDWISTNSKTAMNNIATGAANMWAQMERGSKQLGEQIAFSLGLSDEVLTIPEPTMQAMQEFTGFTPPDTSAATTSVMQNIDAQLAAARAEREAARNAPPGQKGEGGFAPVDFGAGALGAAVAEAASATAAQQVQRGGALQMFQRLQDSLAPKKGEELQKKQIELAKESLEVQRAIATGLTGIPLVPILG
jgi:tape measure domain-containing protein